MKKMIPVLFVVLGLVLVQIYTNNIKKNNQSKNNIKIPKDVIIKKKKDMGIFNDYYDDAKKIVSKMTIKEKVGQLFLVRYNKSDADYLSNFYPGGYILFARDIENHTKKTLKEEIEYNQKINKYPLVIGVDEEGGYVTRVSRFKAFRDEKFKSPKYYYETGGYELLEKVEKEKIELLTSLGFNLNLAPVADVSTDSNDFIYDRSFGRDAKETSTFITNMVNYSNKYHINSCLKHFPGYGNNKDTHTGIAIDKRDYEEFLTNDFEPFRAGIAAKVPTVLVSHNIVECMDKDYPSSLSSKVIDELRNTLGFTGIIMTDDLAMDAVKSYVDDGKAATMAINAGNDMIITSDFITMKDEILKALDNNEIKEETIDKAVTRIIAWKLYSGIIKK